MQDKRSDKARREESSEPGKIPLGQVLLDDIFFVLALGLGIPFLLYTLWGVLEVLNVPHN